MAEISRLHSLVAGVIKGISLSANTLVVGDLKIGAELLTEADLEKLLLAAALLDSNGKFGADDVTVAATPANYTAATQDVEAHLAGIDAELANIGSGAASDISVGFPSENYSQAPANDDNVQTHITGIDNQFGTNNAAIGDLVSLSGVAVNSADLGTFTGSTIADSSTVKSALQSLETAHEEVDQNANDLIALSGVAENATDLGTFTGTTIPNASTVKAALQSLETAVEAANSLDFEFQNSALDYVTDNTVVPVSEVSGNRYVLSHDGGAPHANYDGAAAGDIVEFNGTVWVALTPTTGTIIAVDNEPNVLYLFGGASWSPKAFEATTASTGLTKVGVDVRLADAAENASGIQVSGGAITLNDLGAFDTDDLAEGTNLYFTDARARTAAVADSITDGVTNIAPSQNAVFDALALKLDSTYVPSKVVKSFVAGEAFAANTSFMVRIALTGETAGRVYKADFDASASNSFYAIGFIEGNAAAAKIAGDAVSVVLLGEIQLGSSDTAFAAGEVGQAVHLKAAGAFDAVSQITYAVDQASYRGGIVQETNKILVGNMQLNGIA